MALFRTRSWQTMDLTKLDMFWIEQRYNEYVVFSSHIPSNEIWTLASFSSEKDAINLLDEIHRWINETI